MSPEAPAGGIFGGIEVHAGHSRDDDLAVKWGPFLGAARRPVWSQREQQSRGEEVSGAGRAVQLQERSLGPLQMRCEPLLVWSRGARWSHCSRARDR